MFVRGSAGAAPAAIPVARRAWGKPGADSGPAGGGGSSSSSNNSSSSHPHAHTSNRHKHLLQQHALQQGLSLLPGGAGDADEGPSTPTTAALAQAAAADKYVSGCCARAASSFGRPVSD